MERIANCHCGDLTLVANGEPDRTVMCHCEHCQRRTGTSFNLGAWYSKEDVSHQGDTRTYTRTETTPVTFYFCPNCGSNVFWEAPDLQPGKVAVAAGCFVDDKFPLPTVSLFGKRRHRWLSKLEDVPSFVGGRDSEPET